MIATMNTPAIATTTTTPRIASSPPSATTNSASAENEPQRCCVVCERTSPKTIFSCRYKVHERNMDILQKFFERNDLRFGELCDRCYRLWYKHKRTKPLPNSQGKEGNKASRESLTSSTSSSPASKQHEAFHGKHQDSSEDDDTPVDDSSADEDMQSTTTAATSTIADEEMSVSPKKYQQQQPATPQLVRIFQQQNALQQQKFLTKPAKIEKYVAADFSHCIRALAALAKPTRKSKRKNTPVRSAPRVSSMHELVYGAGATSSTLARIVLLREEQQQFLMSLCNQKAAVSSPQQAAVQQIDQQQALIPPVHETTSHHHEDDDEYGGNDATMLNAESAVVEGNLFARMLQAASSKIAVQSS